MENGSPLLGEVSPSGPSAEVLSELRARLQERARVPTLPDGWRHQSAMLPARGVSYGGDFIVSDLTHEPSAVQLVLVDTCGHGDSAVPAALQLAGALQTAITTLPAGEVLPAVNRFLLAQPSGESIATAVQVELDLVDGDCVVRSAGHPPALHWSAAEQAFHLDAARGMALGVHDDPDLPTATERLAPGDLLLFYTDGVVESRSTAINDGISWLQQVAAEALAAGWDGAAERILAGVDEGDDDRAVLLIQRVGPDAPAE